MNSNKDNTTPISGEKKKRVRKPPLTPTIRRKRGKTAREMAERLGVTPRTIRSYMAQERSEWLTEARARQEQAAKLRDSGMSWAQVAEQMGLQEAAAKQLGYRYRLRTAKTAKQPPTSA